MIPSNIEVKTHWNLRHGQDRKGHVTKVYTAWQSMFTRCYNKKNKRWEDYGGRGIIVCARWQSFDLFHADMGDPPGKEYSIDRKENNGNYEPNNCRWIPMSEQMRNRRNNRWITANGETRLLEDWSKLTGINKTTIFHRIVRMGWSEQDAVTKSPMSLGDISKLGNNARWKHE